LLGWQFNREMPHVVVRPTSAWKAKGNTDSAIADYEMAIRLDPTFASAYYSRGRIYESQGNIERARSDYNATLAVPEKDRIAEWAQDQARLRLRELNK
jgi:tetratricopeptide (TPR) repeat protein